MYVALTYIPGGGLLTGFAMRSDPKDFGRTIRKGSGAFFFVPVRASPRPCRAS